ncbi:MAG: cysteine--tRNA ligase [Candidatus Bathyarchaeota archaeon]|nr:MAG: cysteine--tRNA ligase [Candidatus Bathyarchaeota archaeon]
MTLKIYDTLTRRKEAFKPISGNRVYMFVCGPTLYDYSHLGHARTYVAFDVIARYLRYKGYTLFYLMNITDVEDRIIQRAEMTNRDPVELAKTLETTFHRDMKALRMNSVNLYARASEHMPEILDQIKRLIEKGYAYETKTGIYYDLARFEDFGELSHQKLDEVKKHRIDPDPTKKNPQDFTLWKKKETGPLWDSPWGKGRPGWHIEDTAISELYLGEQYDIHGGGIDLIFPHHESEIVQMESLSGKKPMARNWLHTGLLMISGERMGKSMGNSVTIADALEDYEAEVLRFFFASTHYRSPIDYTKDKLEQAKNSLETLYTALYNIKRLQTKEEKQLTDEEKKLRKELRETERKFLKAMDDDFNTPIAISHLFDMAKKINIFTAEDGIVDKKLLGEIVNSFKELGGILGVLQREKESVEEELIEKLMDLVIELRREFRNRENFAVSDRIREELRRLGITLEDTPDGMKWRKH